ncbi:MAG: hypothetical protein MJZ11_08025 [Lachnospiraceae bacterium]|nr:hypothetical protein [Lachnospiraceae bacterium]
MAYTDEYNTAKELLTEFGAPLKLHKLIDDEYDEKSFSQKKIYKDYNGVGVKLNYSEEVIGEGDNIIKAGDVKFICQLPEDPTEDKDQIIFGRHIYNIITVEDVSPDDEIVIIYKLQCRKAS